MENENNVAITDATIEQLKIAVYDHTNIAQLNNQIAQACDAEIKRRLSLPQTPVVKEKELLQEIK